MMRFTAALVALAASFSFASPAFAYHARWGAIAYDRQGNATAATGASSGNYAMLAAKDKCGPRCGTYPFRGCAAIAFTRDSVNGRRGYELAASSSASRAREMARQGCEATSRADCYIRLSVCN
ncbi:hypothetical protein Srot_0059 [Segniliparus rotundus DSM 44985]|uniref:DUF4189 domain-containing protein n=1 Tax=Segniliparus rotundus (strain ATCC BAA-972 / CDC 1076 / CIP 108378 / DSM 44985 / JCM 13578) TaxID=640132 RepID=D6Z9M5_SEGRD|nr:hypothetical protein Srot_0059 [Segniliparus rotundus DSM 44985]